MKASYKWLETNCNKMDPIKMVSRPKQKLDERTKQISSISQLQSIKNFDSKIYLEVKKTWIYKYPGTQTFYTAKVCLLTSASFLCRYHDLFGNFNHIPMSSSLWKLTTFMLQITVFSFLLFWEWDVFPTVRIHNREAQTCHIMMRT